MGKLEGKRQEKPAQLKGTILYEAIEGLGL